MNEKPNEQLANTCDEIRSKNNEMKCAFIKNVISQTGIPANFTPLPRSSQNKIFHRINGNEEEYREWILFENNTFFCVYCLCFSAMKKHRLIQGIEYVRECRITDALKTHEKETHHERAKSIYLDLVSNIPFNRDDRNAHQSEKRVVLKAIVKIIIFIATHGE